MMNRYDEETHRYSMAGVSVPSVTQILTLAGHIETRWFNESAAERGRRVHAIAERIDRLQQGEGAAFSERDVPEEIGGEVEAYCAFVRDYRPEYDGIERAFWHPTLRYGGRPDRSLRRLLGRGALGTLELKTGAEADWHGLQLAGYERLRPRGSRWVCYLGKNGRYKMRQVTKADDHMEFLRALRDVWATWAARTAEKGERDGDCI